MKNQIYQIILMVSASIGFIGCAGNKCAEHEANIHKAYDALSKRDFATFESLCADDFTELSVGLQPIKGVKAAIEQYKVFLDAFPDAKFEVTEIAPSGKNKYYLKVHITGTNSGNFMMLPPTGKKVDVWDVDIIELNDAGKCVSHWVCDPNSILNAIGYGSISKPATAMAMGAYEAFGKKDIQGVLNLCNDDVVFEIHDGILYPNEARIFKGKQEVAKFFEEVGAKLTYAKFQPNRFLTDGDDVAIFIANEFKYNPTGKNYAGNYYHHMKATNGKISYFKGVLDTPKMM
jgi:ketosteroid isomerase-like protein